MRWLAALFTMCAVNAAAQDVYVGDSITRGMGVPEGKAFPELLGSVNAGVDGSSTRWWEPTPNDTPTNESLLETVLEPLLPAQRVIIMLGHNDAVGFLTGGEPTSRDDYRWRLLRIIYWLTHEQGVEDIVLLGSPQVRGSQGVPSFWANIRLRGYRVEQLAICDSHAPRVTCGPDLFDAWDPLIRDYNPPDWTHPSEDGHINLSVLLGDAL